MFGLGRRPIAWKPPIKKSPAIPPLLFFLLLVLLLAFALVSFFRIKSYVVLSPYPSNRSINIAENSLVTVDSNTKREFPLKCSNQTQTCPRDYYPAETVMNTRDNEEGRTCPDYFRWIHEDLRPWKSTGITRGMVERARPTAHFRLVIVKGRAYVEKFRKSIQTRDLFTIWGILQLLRRYPGRVPDLELMFDCDDRPVVQSRDYQGPNRTGPPPPLFRYCGDRWTADIVFPDWSFWGWAEINLRPWEKLQGELKEGNGRTNWMERLPYAYWKGNPFVADTRRDLLRCNVSGKQDWNARLFIQVGSPKFSLKSFESLKDWILESQQGYKHSGLATQCNHRYKIYIEGYAWSVSEKYILACDSVTLLVKPYFYDFFTRSLVPLKHFWPIKDTDKCRSLKFAVYWGNTHHREAREMGKAASDFILQKVTMENVYDYMFHLLREYAKLLEFEPKVPDGVTELCSEVVACPVNGMEREFMTESLLKGPSPRGWCDLPPPYEEKVIGDMWRRNVMAMRRVERWENEYWQNISHSTTSRQ